MSPNGSLTQTNVKLDMCQAIASKNAVSILLYQNPNIRTFIDSGIKNSIY